MTKKQRISKIRRLIKKNLSQFGVVTQEEGIRTFMDVVKQTLLLIEGIK